MAPSKKSRSVNKKFSYVGDVSPKKDDASKNKQRKRKFSDLGSQWSKEELQQFYEGYRKYGKDWKKVAAVVRNRSVEMVEAVYSLNRAYLSLPEGTASVAGLIAMMTDHYCNMQGSDSEQETDDGAGASRKLQKRGHGKFRRGNPKGLDSCLPDPSNSQPVGMSYGYLSLLDERRTAGSRPRAVGKRTPRVPVSYSYDKNRVQKYFSPSRHGLKSKTTANDDDVAHEIALVLTEASQRGGSPDVSHTPKRKKENVMPSPVQNVGKMTIESELAGAKLRVSEMDEAGLEGSLGSMEADNGDSARDRKYLIDTEGIGTIEVQNKGKKYGKKPETEIGNNHLEDVKEACSGTEQGQILGAVNGKHEPEVAYPKNARSSYKGPKKRSKKVLFGADEGSKFDALQALADLSLMMPSGNDTEYEREKVKPSGTKEKMNYLIPGAEKVTDLDCAVPESKEKLQMLITGMHKSKQKSLASKATDEVRKSASKGKRSSHDATHPKQGKMGKPAEQSSSSTDRRERDISIASTVEVRSSNHVNLPTRVRSRRKMDVPQNLIEIKVSENIINEQSSAPIPSFYDKALHLKEKLSNCLSWYRVRRWCNYEWFYSAIDYPWFAKKEFVEYLDHVGLGHIPRLTRVEWGVIRSSLGKPRRFSEQFLIEEKEKLNQYRESVRTHYSELRAGTREGLPADLARPLSVGQRVMAIHPRTREIHDGSVLTVDHSRCRVQFDRPELGVEFVKDIDCMPLNPWEHIPASFTRPNAAVSNLFENSNDLKMNKDQNLSGYKKVAPNENLETSDGPHILPSTYPTSNLSKQAGSSSVNLQAKVGPGETANSLQVTNSQPSILAQIQAKEADVQALSQLTRALDKKEAVVSELRRMNDEVLENQKDGDNSLKDSESFKKQYAAVLLQLSEVNEQVSSALCCLRQRNTYQGNFPLMWMKPMASVGNPISFSKSSDRVACDTPKSGSNVVEIVESSRAKAQTMVNAALQAMFTLKEGVDGVERIEEVIDHVNNQLSLDESRMPAMRSTADDSGHCILSSQDQLASCKSNPLAAIHALDPKLNTVSDGNETLIPSELIAHCVATLLMIQKCTERQFPPADVAKILDSAVTSLQPCCSQNLPIYVEIQKCMGIIRSQILALIPT